MANIKLSFYGTEKSETTEHELECFANTNQEIYFSINMGDYPSCFVCLDIPTAIKLSKVLRNEINKAKEVNNG